MTTLKMRQIIKNKENSITCKRDTNKLILSGLIYNKNEELEENRSNITVIYPIINREDFIIIFIIKLGIEKKFILTRRNKPDIRKKLFKVIWIIKKIWIIKIQKHKQ